MELADECIIQTNDVAYQLTLKTGNKPSNWVIHDSHVSVYFYRLFPS